MYHCLPLLLVLLLLFLYHLSCQPNSSSRMASPDYSLFYAILVRSNLLHLRL